MKKILSIILCITFALFMSVKVQAQTPPHPNGGNAPSESNNSPVGAGAPIGDGMGLLMLLSSLYFGAKVYVRKRIVEE